MQRTRMLRPVDKAGVRELLRGELGVQRCSRHTGRLGRLQFKQANSIILIELLLAAGQVAEASGPRVPARVDPG